MQGLPLLRQGEEVAAVMEAAKSDGTPLYPTVVVQIPRRATKTTSIWDVILGRCYTRPGTKVVTSAQDGTRARNRFRDVQRALQLQDFEGDKDPANRVGKLRWSNGDESIEFDNGSRIWTVPPDPGAFRSEAADLIFLDEAGEYSLDTSAGLIEGALPLMDTRPMGQIVIAGTPGKVRAGLFWDNLQAGRAKKRGTGIVDYSLGDNEQVVIFPEGEEGEPRLDRKVLRRVHPGIGTLTTWATMETRFQSMPLEKFEREYCCRWPFESSVSAISEIAWKECSAGPDLPERPARVGLGFDVDPDSSAASLVAAWRDDEGRAVIEVIADRPGTDWLAAVGKKAATKHRTAIGHDGIGANIDPSERLTRARVRTNSQGLRDMQAAAARIHQDIEKRNLRHFNQPDLDAAVAGATWRNVGEGGRLFARKNSSAPVRTLVAASVALRQYDAKPVREEGITIVTAT